MTRSSHRVLVTAAGTGTSFGVIASLKEHWPGPEVWVAAGDMLPPELVPASSIADHAVRLPALAAPDYWRVVTEIIDELEIETYVPIIETEVVAALDAQRTGRLPENVTVASAGASAANTCVDKLTTARWLAERGLPTPVTVSGPEAQWKGEPLVAKPRVGAGSEGVCVLSSLEEFQQAPLGDDSIVQEACQRPELTLDVFRSTEGFTRTICRERIEVKAGVCTKARVFEDPQLADLATAVATGLDVRGTICIQVMRAAADDRWLVTDLNCRPGAGTRMTAAAGVDLLAAWFADLWSDPRTAQFACALPRECFVVRSWREWVH